MKTWEVKEPGCACIRVRAWTEKGARRHYRRECTVGSPLPLDVREVTPDELAWEADSEARFDAMSY